MDNKVTGWINKVLSELSQLDGNKGVEILNQCGGNCCQASAWLQGAVAIRAQFKNSKDSDKLFNEFKSKFYNSDNFNKNGNVIRLIFEECTCPMVKGGVDNPFLCNCTMGYSKKVFEALFEKKVVIHLEKSILRGSSVCEQHIKIMN